MKLFRRRFNTYEELLKFWKKVKAYGHGYFPISFYTENGYEYIEYGKDDGKDKIDICIHPWKDEV